MICLLNRLTLLMTFHAELLSKSLRSFSTDLVQHDSRLARRKSTLEPSRNKLRDRSRGQIRLSPLPRPAYIGGRGLCIGIYGVGGKATTLDMVSADTSNNRHIRYSLQVDLCCIILAYHPAESCVPTQMAPTVG